jgi:hypothetical protein
VEKRVFSLTDTADLVYSAVNTVVFMALATLALWDSWHDPVARYTWAAGLVVLMLVQWWWYVSRRDAKLEVSEEGLFIMSRRGLGHRLRWDDVTSCRVTPAPRWRDWPFMKVILSSSPRRVIVIPGWCPGAAEIISILKQRLPESVFEAR